MFRKGRQSISPSHWDSVIDSRVRVILKYWVPRVLKAEMTESSRISRVLKAERTESSRVPRVPEAEMTESSRVPYSIMYQVWNSRQSYMYPCWYIYLPGLAWCFYWPPLKSYKIKRKQREEKIYRLKDELAYRGVLGPVWMNKKMNPFQFLELD